jgi:hypothetical protein
MPRQEEKFVLNCDSIKAETDKAILVVVEDQEHWLPLSQVHEIHRNSPYPRLVITPWIAKKIGAY